jgi:Mce-associated membrane protein
MTSSQNPSWYDVLGVSRDATPDQIKTAWRDATDKFEPGSGSGQFRMFNEAADVLLDPARRQAYDESLDGSFDEAPPVDLSKDPVPAAPPPAVLPKARRSRRPGRAGKTEKSRPVGEPASRTAVILTLVVALLTVLALVTAGYFGLQVRRDARVADARDEAPASAERAAKAMLSYDYRQLPADRKRASVYLTDKFGKSYLKAFDTLEQQKDGTPGLAVQTKTVLIASVLGSGVMDAEENKVRVLVYVNQISKKPGADPQIFQNRVAMTMKHDGNRWLVADLKSY